MSAVDLLRRLARVRNERGELTSDLFRLMARRRLRKLLDGHETGRILDAGGGSGLLFDPSAWNGAGKVIVLDLDQSELVTAKRAYNPDRSGFICGDITRLPFRDGAFDTTVCIGTFYNFPGEDAIAAGLRELARVTRHGGSIYTEFRNAGNPLVRLLYRHAAAYDRSLGRLPLRAYRVKDIERLHRDTGLEPVTFTSLGLPGRLFSLGFIVKSLKEKR